MKTLIYTIASIALLSSCNNSIQDKVVDYTKKQMKDPRSFELASVKVVDTLHKSDELYGLHQTYHELCQIEIGKSETSLELAKIWRGGYTQYKADEYYRESQDALDKAKIYNDTCVKITELIKSIEKTPKDSLVAYKYYISAYAKNSFGQRVLGEWNVIVSPKADKFEILEAKSSEMVELEQNLEINKAKMSVF